MIFCKNLVTNATVLFINVIRSFVIEGTIF